MCLGVGMARYLGYIKYDENDFCFLVALKKFGDYKFDNEDYNNYGSKFIAGIRLEDYDYAIETNKLNDELIYTFKIEDKDLKEGNTNILGDNIRKSDNRFYGKKLYFKRNENNRISLKSLKEDNSCSEIFIVKKEIKLNEIYNYLNNFTLEHEPITNSIFLTDNKDVIGPFSVQNSENTDEHTYKLIPYGTENYKIDVYDYTDFSEYCNEINVQNERMHIHTTLIFNEIVASDKYLKIKTTQDCMPADVLIKWFTKRYSNNINKDTVTSMTISAEDVDFKFTEDRKQRLLNFIENRDNNNEQIQDFIQRLLDNRDFTDTLISLNPNVTNNRKLEEDKTLLQDQLNESETKYLKLQKEYEEKNKYIAGLEEEKKKLLVNQDEKIKIYNDFENIKEEIENLKNEKQKIEEQKKQADNEYEAIVNLNARAKIEKENIIKDFDRLLTEKYNNQEVIKSTLENSFSTAFLSKILEKTSKYQDENERSSILPMKYSGVDMYKKYEKPKEIIKDLHSFFEQNGRKKYSRNDIANILICMSQGFLTIFAGEPGTGKTSFVKLLASFLGLKDNSRYAEISVEKGWTTKRDFLGYYNPLTKEINVANRELYNGLRLLDKEAQEKIYDFPYIVLLDEANLSPMEYYWADFMKVCDYYKENNCQINLFDNYSLTIPKTLRFFATVNLDHTTEILSPRLIDRSWIIKLPSEDFSLDDKFEYEDTNEKYPLVGYDIFENINNTFEAEQNNLKLHLSVINKFENIQKIFKEVKISFSPRVIGMIRKYCIVAKELDLMETNGNELVALDYAISQKILPMINGQGDKYKDFIENLIRTTDRMPICNKILNEIKSNTEKNGMDYYHYFAR